MFFDFLSLMKKLSLSNLKTQLLSFVKDLTDNRLKGAFLQCNMLSNLNKQLPIVTKLELVLSMLRFCPLPTWIALNHYRDLPTEDSPNLQWHDLSLWYLHTRRHHYQYDYIIFFVTIVVNRSGGCLSMYTRFSLLKQSRAICPSFSQIWHIGFFVWLI
jgi:hypothetical protein